MAVLTRAAAACVAALLALPAQADEPRIVGADDPEALRQIAEQFGAARLDRDSYGDPLIIGMMAGINYIVEFYGCDNGRNCKELLFRAAFQSDAMTTAEMAAWNRDSHFGKVYIDAEGDPAIEMDVILTGGVSEANMIDTFDLWSQALAEFVRYIGWNS